jgi:electron transfer flavoprotein alpha/beta subunit
LPEVIKKPLSMGADELVFLEDEAFEGGDSWSTAHALNLFTVPGSEDIQCGIAYLLWHMRRYL